jgi:hypothetical protein
MAKKPKGSNLAKFQAVGGPYALMKCKDCGRLGCLVPVPHAKFAVDAKTGTA